MRGLLSEKEPNHMERRCQGPGKKVKSLHHYSMKTATWLSLKKAPTLEDLMRKLEKLKA
jgi:hypothetical protein